MLGDSGRAESFIYIQKTEGKIFQLFWDEELGGFTHNFVDGENKKKMTRYPNIFAILFNYLDLDQQRKAREQVLFNPEVQVIKTLHEIFRASGFM